jgi:N-acetylmuramic acid 6-phosphate etherase
VVVALTASGRTPYALGALRAGRARGAFTVLISAIPHAELAGEADIHLGVDTGPEVIAGSTRMKAGTAAKMALGLLSSAAFVQLGAVRAGRMVALRPASEKLRRRAVRTVAELGGVGEAAARRLLSAAGWDVARAVEAAERRGRSR